MPIYAQLMCEDYNKRIDNQPFVKSDFYREPTKFESTFMNFAKKADMYIACHYWHAHNPYILTRSDLKNADCKIKVIGDISCDIDGPVGSTIRPSTIKEPLYGYDPVSECEVNFSDESAITRMAVDNLPCELPLDASEDFGKT